MTEFLISCFFPEFHINHVLMTVTKSRKGGSRIKGKIFKSEVFKKQQFEYSKRLISMKTQTEAPWQPCQEPTHEEEVFFCFLFLLFIVRQTWTHREVHSLYWRIISFKTRTGPSAYRLHSSCRAAFQSRAYLCH